MEPTTETSSSTDQVSQLDSVVQDLQSSIGAVSTNLLSAYQKMAENMERSMQMMSNANKMMESFVLQNIDIRPSIRPSEDRNIYIIAIEVMNKTNIPLKHLSLLLEPKGLTEESLPVFISHEGDEIQTFTTDWFDVDALGTVMKESRLRVSSTCNIDITLFVESPGTGKPISKTVYSSLMFLPSSP